jgi:hypothetical protein
MDDDSSSTLPHMEASIHTWILAGLISSFIFILPLSAQEPAKDTISQIVVVEGVGASPEEAIKDAFRKAVLQVGGSVIYTETQIKKFEVINEEVGSFYRISIKAEVEKKSLLAKLRSSEVMMHRIDQDILITTMLIEFRSKKNASATGWYGPTRTKFQAR